MSLRKIYKTSLKDLDAFASSLTAELSGGEILGLCGPLGSGKTTFTKHLAKHLGFPGLVSSPTFTLMQTYSPVQIGKVKGAALHHLDLYRIENEDELQALGLEEYLNSKPDVAVVEWLDKFPDYFSTFQPVIIEFKP